MKSRNLSNVPTRDLFAEIGHRTGRAMPTVLLPLILILASPGYLVMRAIRTMLGYDRVSHLPEMAFILVTAAWMVYLFGTLALLALWRF